MEPSAIFGLKQKSWRHLGAEPNLWPWPSQFSRPRGRAARPRASSGTPSAVRGTWKTTANGSTNSGGTPMVNVRNSEHSIYLLTSTYYGFSQTYSPMRGAWPPPAAPALRTSAHQKPLRPTGRSRLSTQKKTRGVDSQKKAKSGFGKSLVSKGCKDTERTMGSTFRHSGECFMGAPLRT